MSLPEEGVAANTLPEVTTIPTGKKLIFTDPDTNEGGIITLENLSKQILQNLTSQTFALDQGNLTLLQALNQLNSKIAYSNPDFSAGVIRRFGRVCGVLINNGEFTSDGHANFTIPQKFRPAISTDFVDTYSKIRFSINTDGTIDQCSTPYSAGSVRGYFTYISEE